MTTSLPIDHELHPAGAQYVGAKINRVEDPRFLRGEGRFVDDMSLPGMLHAAFLRSPVAHANITSIDTSRAAALPGVTAVFTGQDLEAEGIQPIVSRAFLPGMGDNLREPLPTKKVRYVGEAVAVVVADSRYIAEDACELIDVEYERLPAVIDPEGALDPGAALLHEDLPANLIGRKSESHGDPERVFAEADHVFSHRFVHGRVAGVPIECRGVIAEYDRGREGFLIYSSTQIPHLTRSVAAECFGLAESDLQVIAPDVGGGFGIKAHPYIEEVVIPFAARRIGRPVKWIEDRYEHLSSAVHAKELVMDLELAVAADGTFLGMRGRYNANAGAYGCFPQTGMVDAMCAATLLPSLYKVDHVSYEILAVYTNKCMTGTYRGVGWGAGHTAREVLIDDAARALGRDPLELRLQNCIPSEPYRSVVGMNYDGGSYQESMEQARDALDYDALRERQAKLREEGRYIGVGFSPFVEPAGFGSKAAAAVGQKHQVTYDWGSVTLEGDGTVTVRMGFHSHGQGHETTFAQVAADQLGVRMEDVRIKYGDTEGVPYSTGTFASRSGVIGSGLIMRAGGDVRDKLLRLAAHLMEVSPADIELSGGKAFVRGAPDTARTIKEVAQYAYFGPGSRQLEGDMALTSTRSYDPPESYSNGTIAVVVEVDPETGKVTIERTVAIEDCGVMLNPTIVEGQVAGAVAQGIGGALYEEFVYDDDGNFLSGTLLDYLLASSMEVGPIEVHHIETPSPVTDGGIKGMGEAGTLAAPAAVLNAVADALSPFGVTFTSTPITASLIRDAVAAKREGEQ
ncbi:MAG TPA: xanthine dehydrogenase family protein molybdopterin-binding subunit [Thermoleophilaceae bacterium]|jgi:carbon-monoxide dehydrogenase large subunit|nr:xanthine dehydrogenase family protein molybdopterin-binding subunit [Thermoleophilaceae bacterium]